MPYPRLSSLVHTVETDNEIQFLSLWVTTETPHFFNHLTMLTIETNRSYHSKIIVKEQLCVCILQEVPNIFRILNLTELVLIDTRFFNCIGSSSIVSFQKCLVIDV